MNEHQNQLPPKMWLSFALGGTRELRQFGLDAACMSGNWRRARSETREGNIMTSIEQG